MTVSAMHALHVKSQRGLSIERGGTLPALLVISISFGVCFQKHIGTSTLQIYWAQVLIFAIIMVQPLRKDHRLLPIGVKRAAILTISMVPALIFAESFESSVVAYVNFVSGICGGLIVATDMKPTYPKMTVLDWSFIAIPLITSFQLLSTLSGASEIDQLHQNATTSWGQSNYVAGLMIVWNCFGIPRLLITRAPRWVFLVVIFTTSIALLTLSRGAAVTTAVGLLSVGWWAASRTKWKLATRLLSMGVLLVGYEAVATFTRIRGQINDRVDQNIGDRFTLYHLAWKDFISSPVTGRGWLAIRSESISATGLESSFAHNFFLSFLQMGGLCALPVIIIVLSGIISLYKSGSPMWPAALAGFALSMTDPVFEGWVGGLTMWTLLIGASFAYHSNNSQY